MVDNFQALLSVLFFVGNWKHSKSVDVPSEHGGCRLRYNYLHGPRKRRHDSGIGSDSDGRQQVHRIWMADWFTQCSQRSVPREKAETRFHSHLPVSFFIESFSFSKNAGFFGCLIVKSFQTFPEVIWAIMARMLENWPTSRTDWHSNQTPLILLSTNVQAKISFLGWATYS